MSVLADRQNPWLGLAAYGESECEFFFGREHETAELLRLIEDETLVVLYGVSGLGKSSLLNAGIFPRLRSLDFVPRYLRLDHEAPGRAGNSIRDVSTNADYYVSKADDIGMTVDQMIDNWRALSGSLSAQVLYDWYRPAQIPTLWEFYHRVDAQLWSPRQRPLTRVLAFDQFEEIFTTGEENPERRARTAAFLQGLSDLTYNRPPADFQRRLEVGEAKAEDYVFDPVPLRVVISLREDFLPQLSELRERGFPTLLRAALRLRPLSIEAARECIERPAPELLDPGVATRLVNFLAGAEAGAPQVSSSDLSILNSQHPTAVEPALLSVVCRELNAERQRRGLARINADLLNLSQEQILADFYERSFDGVAPALRIFVEKELLSPGGYRDSRALDDALSRPGIAQPDIHRLVDRRLLHYQDRQDGPRRIELTHDLLCRVVRASGRQNEDEEKAQAAEAARLKAEEEARVAVERVEAAEVARAEEERRRSEAERLRAEADVARKRSRHVAFAALCIALLAFAALAFAAWQWQRAEGAKEEANGAKVLAEQRAGDLAAEKNRVEAEKARVTESEKNEKAARQLAEERERAARAAEVSKNQLLLKAIPYQLCSVLASNYSGSTEDFWAPSVEYFEYGKLSQAQVLSQHRRDSAQYPFRNYTVTGIPAVSDSASDDSWTINFGMNYTLLDNQRRPATGELQVTLRVDRKYQVTHISEEVVRARKK